MMNDLFCVCGHRDLEHRNKKYPLLESIVDNDCRYPLLINLCLCYKFKLDNLKYLEQLYEAKHK
jgi:hypothetical protein